MATVKCVLGKRGRPSHEWNDGKKDRIYCERSAAIEAAKHAWAKGLEPSQYIEALPAADVAPVVHGRWISFLDGDHIMPERYYRCSRCGRVESRWRPYCNCGAKMD